MPNSKQWLSVNSIEHADVTVKAEPDVIKSRDYAQRKLLVNVCRYLLQFNSLVVNCGFQI